MFALLLITAVALYTTNHWSTLKRNPKPNPPIGLGPELNSNSSPFYYSWFLKAPFILGLFKSKLVEAATKEPERYQTNS